jgi:predicted nucleic acid-binding protein
MKIVIDASVALKWVIPEVGSDAAVNLRSSELIAPALWLAEVANALWRHVVRGELDRDEAQVLLALLQTAPITNSDIEADMQSALALANELAHPIYDCIYLALALRENTHVVTADRRFVAIASRHVDLRERIRLLI